MLRTEVPVVFQDWSTVHHRQRPSTPLDALMRATPFNEPDDSVVGLLPLREAVAECIEALSDEDQFMLDATFVERVSVRDLAARMGLHKSYTHRLVQRAQVRLRDVCIQHATIQAYLGVAGAVSSAPPLPQSSAAGGVASGAA